MTKQTIKQTDTIKSNRHNTGGNWIQATQLLLLPDSKKMTRASSTLFKPSSSSTWHDTQVYWGRDTLEHIPYTKRFTYYKFTRKCNITYYAHTVHNTILRA